MRAILLILILVVVAAIIALATGLLNIDMLRAPQAPALSASGNGITATGGQAPAFDVQTGSVTVGTQPTTVPLPTVGVNPADGQQPQPATQPPAQTGPQQPQPQQQGVVNGNSTQ
jgi:hypothetical protein